MLRRDQIPLAHATFREERSGAEKTLLASPTPQKAPFPFLERRPGGRSSKLEKKLNCAKNSIGIFESESRRNTVWLDLGLVEPIWKPGNRTLIVLFQYKFSQQIRP